MKKQRGLFTDTQRYTGKRLNDSLIFFKAEIRLAVIGKSLKVSTKAGVEATVITSLA